MRTRCPIVIQPMIFLDTKRLTAIALTEDASELTRYAASELQKYLELVTGERLPVKMDACASNAIRLELSADGFASAKHDRIRVFADGDSLVLHGENQIAVLYAVYDFLQEFCNVRFFAPGAEFEDVPRTDELIIPSNRLPWEHGSAMAIRDFVNRTNSHDALSFAVKSRVNTVLGCGPWLNGSEKANPVNAALIHSFGLKVRGPGHSWKHFVPDDSLFAEHPEYFPLLNGRRTVTGRTACFSNPFVQNIFRDKVRAYLKEHPYWDIFAFWAEDTGEQWYCECDECRKKSTTDWYFDLGVIAADVLAEELPDATFEWIAYQGTLQPPQMVKSLRDNGRKMLVNCCVNQTRDLYHPMDYDCPPNRKLLSIIRSWQEFLKGIGYEGRFMMMEYYNLCEYPNYGPCGHTLLWPLEVMQHDVRFYREHGVTGMGAFTGFDKLAFPTPLRLWAWMKLWNAPDLDLESLKCEFYRRYFKGDADVVKSYCAKLEQLMPLEATDENLKEISSLAPRIANIHGQRGDALRVHLEYCLLAKRVFKAFLDDDRAEFERWKKEFLAFPEHHARLLSSIVAPFPFLWFDFWFFQLCWLSDGQRSKLRDGWLEFLK